MNEDSLQQNSQSSSLSASQSPSSSSSWQEVSAAISRALYQTPAMVTYNEEDECFEILLPNFAAAEFISRLEATKVEPDFIDRQKSRTKPGPTLSSVE